jgi:hypothetical protein
METISVTQQQFDRIEAAWAICSHGNARKAVGGWSKTFRECVAEVIGRDPADTFTLDIAAVQAEAIRYDGLHEYAQQHGLDYNELCRVVRSAIGELAVDERQLFEVWAAQFKFDLTRADPSYVNEPYANQMTDWSWLAWQAARAAIAKDSSPAP